MISNNSEPNQSWGSNASDVPSSSLVNFKFFKLFSGIVRFRNDQIAKIMGYGYYQMGNVMISRVYYVEGLGHNLIFVGQFCDSDLEVAFRKHTCYIRDLEGVDILKGTRGSNLYTLYLEDMMLSSPICLLSNASKIKSWLWHRSEDLSKLKPKADIGIFVDYAPAKKSLIPNPTSLTSYVPPTKKDWDILFQPMFDEYFNPPPSVASPVPTIVAPEPADSTCPPSSTTIDQDAPSTNNDPFFGVPIPEPNFEESSSMDVIPNNVHSVNQPLEHLSKWTKDHRIMSLAIPHDPSLQDINYKMKPYQDNFNHVYKLKKALYRLKQAPGAWYDLLSSFLLSQKVSKGVNDPTLLTRKESKDILLYGMETSDPVDIPMMEKSKLDVDPQGKEVDPTRYRRMIGSLMYLTSSRPDLVFSVCMCARYQTKPTEMHLHAVKQIIRYLRGTINMGVWYSKDSCIALTAFVDVDHAGCQDTRRSTSGMSLLYAITTSNIPDPSILTSDTTSSRSKCKNGVVELYFIKTEYQLEDIFTKALERERLDFLINKLGMKSMSPETLKRLAEEEEE
ncbi:hypothetical protein Tco_0968329 [Tanacetum coccineum]